MIFQNHFFLKIFIVLQYVGQLKFDRFNYQQVRYRSTAIVLMHGMGAGYDDLYKLKGLIEKHVVPRPYVKLLRVGNSKAGDVFNSFFMGFEKQIQIICKMIKADPNLSEGYNAIGFSQGGVILRGVVETCLEGPPVIHLITLCSPHQGFYGMFGDGQLRNKMFKISKKLMKLNWVNNRILQAGFWHDIDPKIYERKSYLAVINNEKEVNYAYRDKIVKLKKFVIVYFLKDTILTPPETQVFGFFKPNSVEDVLKMKDTDLYKEDKIGLKELNDKGKLDVLEVDADHCVGSVEWFINQIIKRYLD